MSRTQFLLHANMLALKAIMIVVAEQAELKFAVRLIQQSYCVALKVAILKSAIVSTQTVDALHAVELQIQHAAESKGIGLLQL
jgi:hypothetical protein